MLKEEQPNARIETVGSAQEALALVNRELVDVVIVDGEMADIDSLNLIEAVQGVYPKTHAILISTADQGEIRERRRNRPAVFTSFTKPFSIETFLRHIDRVLVSTALRPVARHQVYKKEACFGQTDRYGNGLWSRSSMKPAVSPT
jgi:DNA-binding NtrC family response regulator